MTAIEKAQLKLTPQEYLARERVSEVRHEFYRGEVFAMAGASEAHNLIADNITFALRERLRGQGCRAYSSDMRVKVAANGLYTYPDSVVACPPIEFEDEERITLLNPQVIVEVLSESTQNYDRTRKFDLYRELPSLRQYVLISQDGFRVDSYQRQQDGIAWLMLPLSGADAVLEIPAVGCVVPFAEIYRDVEFVARDERA